MKRYRVAIIGLGRMGSTIDDEVRDYPPVVLPYSIAATCQASDRLDLVAGADLLEEKRQAFRERWGVDHLYENFQEMIEKEEPDLVAICTKGENHSELTVQVAQTGVPMIYCEKAMACSMKETDAARDAVKASGARFLTGVLRRWKTQFQEGRRRIQAGDIGEPRHAVHYALTSLLHGHVHSIDTLSYLLGDPKAISTWGELRPKELAFENGRIDKDPGAVYNIEFEGGIEAITIPAGFWDFEIYGTEGVLRLSNNGVHMSLRKKVSFSGRFQPYMEAGCARPALERSSVLNMLDDLVDAHEEGRPTLGDIEQAHHITEILFAIAECHHLKAQRVSLPVQNRDLYVSHV